MTQSQIERRRRWIEEIDAKIIHDTGYSAMTSIDPGFAALWFRQHRKRLLSLLRRVRRCPECKGAKIIPAFSFTYDGPVYKWGSSRNCPTCGGTGRL